MKRIINKIISSLLAIVFIFSCVPAMNYKNALNAIAANDSSQTGESGVGSGDVIEFGSYPQSRVTNSNLISSLNGLLSSDSWQTINTSSYQWRETSVKPTGDDYEVQSRLKIFSTALADSQYSAEDIPGYTKQSEYRDVQISTSSFEYAINIKGSPDSTSRLYSTYKPKYTVGETTWISSSQYVTVGSGTATGNYIYWHWCYDRSYAYNNAINAYKGSDGSHDYTVYHEFVYQDLSSWNSDRYQNKYTSYVDNSICNHTSLWYKTGGNGERMPIYRANYTIYERQYLYIKYQNSVSYTSWGTEEPEPYSNDTETAVVQYRYRLRDGSAEGEMKYADVVLEGNRYRAVKFSDYKAEYSGYISDDMSENPIQQMNGYEINNVYWFKFEPLKWRVLDAETGLVFCENIIDAQPFNSSFMIDGNEYYYNGLHSFFANSFSMSTIKLWLNQDFYNTAFTSSEKEQIESYPSTQMEQENSYPNMQKYDDKAIGNSSVQVFLLSARDLQNSSYGFNSDIGYQDKARCCSTTDYYLSQSGYAKTDEQISYYWIRNYSSASDSAGVVANLHGEISVKTLYNSCVGVRPAIKLSTVHDQQNKVSIDKTKIYVESDFIQYGEPHFLDNKFTYSTNGIEAYGNRSNTSISKVAKEENCPTMSKHMIRIAASGAEEPGIGGFKQFVTGKNGDVYYHVIIAKIPEGYRLNAFYNTLYCGAEVKYLTSTQGTGEWELYIAEIKYGLLETPTPAKDTGMGYVYLTGEEASSSSPVVWYVGYANVFNKTGEKIYTDGGFSSGVNSLQVYNNNSSASNNVVVTRTVASSDCPTNTGYMMQITTSAGTSKPGLGGFYQSTTPAAGMTYYHKMRAKIPQGYRLEYKKNDISGSFEWVTDNKGTGDWENYVYKVVVNRQPVKTDTFGFVALYPDAVESINNDDPVTISESVTWYLAYSNIYRIYEFEDNLTKADLPVAATKLYDGQEYALYNYSISNRMAELVCEKIGGHLATIANGDENAAVYSLINSFSPSTPYYWIDGFDEQTEGTWRYSNGETLSYENWASDQPDHYQGVEHYIHMNPDGKWNDNKNEYAAQGFVCEFETALVPQNTVCWRGHIYSLYNKNLSWSDAKTLCENMGGHLATIATQEEQNTVASLLTDAKLTGYYIGASDAAAEGTWKWVDTGAAFWQGAASGTAKGYSNWASGEPNNNAPGEEDYATIYKSNASWNDDNGSKQASNGFICEVEYYKLSPANSGVYNGHTYEVYETLMSWLDAKKIAEQKGGHLVTITTLEESDYVESLLTSEYRYPYAIGLKTTAVNQAFSWVTGEKSFFSDWNSSDPSGSFGCGENFVSLYYNFNGSGKYDWVDMRNIRGSFAQYFIIEYDTELTDVTFDRNNGTAANILMAPSVYSGWQSNDDGTLCVAYDTVSVTFDPKDETFCFDSDGKNVAYKSILMTIGYTEEIKEGSYLTYSTEYVSGSISGETMRLVLDTTDKTSLRYTPDVLALDFYGDEDYDNSSPTYMFPYKPITGNQANFFSRIHIWVHNPSDNGILDNYKVRLKASITDEPLQSASIKYSELAKIVTSETDVTKINCLDNPYFKVNQWFYDANLTNPVGKTLNTNNSKIMLYADLHKISQTISIKTTPQVLVYYVGDNVNTNDLVLSVDYKDGTHAEITSGFEVRPSVLTKAGTQYIAVVLDGNITTYPVTVLPVTTTGIEVESLPEKVTYYQGDTLDLTGLKVNLVYNNGSKTELDSIRYTLSKPDMNTVGTKTVTVEYKTYSATFEITVDEVTVSNVSIECMPNKTSYYVGDELDTTGLKLHVTYNNDTEATVTDGFTIDNNNLNTIGTKTVMLKYSGQTVTFEVNVEAVLPESLTVEMSNTKKIGSSRKVGGWITNGRNR